MAKERTSKPKRTSNKGRTTKKSSPPTTTISLQGFDELLEELQGVKLLLMLLLAKLGSESEELAMALGIGASTVRKKNAFRQVERLPLPSEDE